MGELKALINAEFNDPNADIVRYFAKQVYPSIITPKVLEQFTQLTKKSFQQYINDLITDRLKTALKTEQNDQKAIESVIPTVIENNVETTPEELESFQIVKSIVRKAVPISKVTFRDAQSYFAILFDNNNRKPICRIYLNGGKKFISLFDEAKVESKKEIKTLDDIFDYSENLISTATSYLTVKKEVVEK